MLQLVRSQQACIERIRSAVRWAPRLTILVGASGQGKTTIIEHLALMSSVNPLRLEGKVISDRTDAVLRLMGMNGLRPEGSCIDMLERLQVKLPAGPEYGIPEIIVEDAHCLAEPVLELLHELGSGSYGRRWSILLVGEDVLVSLLQSLRPIPAIASVVLLPEWDQNDLEQAISKLYPESDKRLISDKALQSLAMHPKQLLRSIIDDDSCSNDEELPQDLSYKTKWTRLTLPWMKIAGIILAGFVTGFALFQMGSADNNLQRQTVIPLDTNQK